MSYVPPLSVTRHAVWRAAERFPGFDPLDIEPEVTAAFAAGRVSPDKPPGVLNRTDPGALYAWTPDGLRVYVLKTNRNDEHRSFAVISVIKAASGATSYVRDLLVIEPIPPPTSHWGRR